MHVELTPRVPLSPRPEACRPAVRPVVLLLGPDLAAVSGVSTHLRMLYASPLGERFALVHHQVGSEGRHERAAQRWWRLLAGPAALARAIVQRHAAVVHINTSLNPRAIWRDLAHLAIARACGARVLLQVHGGALPQDFCRASGALAALLRAALQMADAIVVLAQIELDAYRVFLPQHTVVRVPNAVPCQRGPLPARRARADALRLLYVGRLVRTKGLFELLQGLRIANAQGATHHLTIAGQGPDAQALQELARTMRVAEHVSFVGAVDDAGRARLLGRADVFALPSKATEGLPYALLEAMAAGVPVLTTAVGAIPDVVVDGVHGRFVAAGSGQAIADAIAAFARNRPPLARMGQACRARVAEAYSIEGLARGFGLLYAQLLAARPGARAFEG